MWSVQCALMNARQQQNKCTNLHTVKVNGTCREMGYFCTVTLSDPKQTCKHITKCLTSPSLSKSLSILASVLWRAHLLKPRPEDRTAGVRGLNHRVAQHGVGYPESIHRAAVTGAFADELGKHWTS